MPTPIATFATAAPRCDPLRHQYHHGVIVTNAETGRFAVYNYDFATDTRGAVIFEHPEVDVTDAIFSPEGAVDGSPSRTTGRACTG